MTKSIFHYFAVYALWSAVSVAVSIFLARISVVLFGNLVPQMLVGIVAIASLTLPCYAVGHSFVKHERCKPTRKQGLTLAASCAFGSLVVIALLIVGVDLLEKGQVTGLMFIYSGFGSLLPFLIFVVLYTLFLSLPNSLFIWLSSRRAYKRIDAAVAETFS